MRLSSATTLERQANITRGESMPALNPLPRSRKPLIGVTGPGEGGAAAWLFSRFSVYLAGGRAIRITPGQPRSIEGLSGLIIGGGADVDPRLYGAEHLRVLPGDKPADESWVLYLLEWVLLPITWIARKISACCTGKYNDPQRDELEWALIDQAVQRRLPVLGICRGAQLLNVYFGGTLHQDLKSFYTEDPEVRTILPAKRIEVEEGTLLERLSGRLPRRVNALHRQAICDLGEGIRVAARDRNGIVQAIEHADYPFLIGVQWHPEYLPQLPEQRAIFDGLVVRAQGAHSATDGLLKQKQVSGNC